MIGDNTGENISNENPFYCELTALYWAWKNYEKIKNPEYIGLSHYRRLFKFNESEKANKILTKNSKTIKPYKLYFPDKEIEKTINSYDLILPKADDLRTYILKDKGIDTIYDHYKNEHYVEDLDLAIKIINNKYPNFATSTHKALYKNHNVYWANMFIMKKKLFFEYCEWYFSIIGEIKKDKNFQKRLREYDSFQSRIYGFLAERLFNVYIQYLKDKRKEIKIKEIESIQIKPYFTENKLSVIKLTRTNLKPENINLFFALNDTFVQHFTVALASILTNSNATDYYNINVLVNENGLTKENKNKIKTLHKIRNFNLKYIKINETLFKNFPLHLSHIRSLSTYYRFILTDIAPNIDKALYLDCDLVINSDLYFLWNTDISNFYAAGVEDCHWLNIEHKLNLGLKPNEPYVNAGVLLLNLKKMRQDSIKEKFFHNLKKIKNKIKYDDQDVINYTFKGKIKLLPPKYNLLVWFSYAMREGWRTSYNWYEMVEGTQNPAIIHYAGETKPWNINEENQQWQHPNWKLYFKYLLLTPYKYKYSIYLKYKIKKYSELLKFIFSVKFEKINHIYYLQLLGVKIDFSQLFSMLSKIYKKIFKQ